MPSLTLTLEAKIIGRRTAFERRPLPLLGENYTLESLIAELVAHEVAAYHERQDSVSVLRVLTEQELSDGAAAGKIQIAPQERASTVSAEEAIQTALLGFKDGLYYVFVDDQQIETLDAPVPMREGSTLLLLRLTALAGG